MPWSDLSKLGADRLVPIARAVHDAPLATPKAAYALLRGLGTVACTLARSCRANTSRTKGFAASAP